MKETIATFCRSRENGLCLLDLPTGSGKTHEVVNFIAENYNKPEYKDAKFFFITTLKKNLPVDELKQLLSAKEEESADKTQGLRYNKAGQPVTAFEKDCICINANADVVINKFNDVVISQTGAHNNVWDDIAKTEEFLRLKEAIKLITAQSTKKSDSADSAEEHNDAKHDNDDFKRVVKELEQERRRQIRDSLEPDFRRLIVKKLDVLGNSTEKLNAISNDPKYHWIGELYPAVYSRDRRIFLMSVDKFVLGNTTLIEPHYDFLEHEITQKAIIFIDEFDASKDKILERIIDERLKCQINLLNLFVQIYHFLRTGTLPAELTANEAEYIENNRKSHSRKLDDRVAHLRRIFNKTYLKYNMECSFRTKLDDNQESRYFLLHDLQYHSIAENNLKYVQINRDSKNLQNWLTFTDVKPQAEDSLRSLLDDMKGCLRYFLKTCRSMAIDYKQAQDKKRQPTDDVFTFQAAVSSVLHAFRLSRGDIDYLTPLVMTNTFRIKKSNHGRKRGLKSAAPDRSVYERGLQKYDLVNSPMHNLQSDIIECNFAGSPEKWLRRLAQRARVIGISATATLPTVVGNYDLEYLHDALGTALYKIPQADMERIRRKFAEFTSGYEQVQIHVEPIFVRSTYKQNLQEIFSVPANIEYMLEEMKQKYPCGHDSSQENFFGSRVLRVAKALKHFICNDAVKSCLCLCNVLPKAGSHALDSALIKEFAERIIAENGKPYEAENIVAVLDGQDYDAKQCALARRLSQGEKIFVMSSYNTLGAGQNLQYAIPNGMSLVKTSNAPRKDTEKDFDCIYLENPTHLIEHLNQDTPIEDKAFIKYLFQLAFLMEAGELSLTDGDSLVHKAFALRYGSRLSPSLKVNPYICRSVNNSALRTLVQAVGRICRTVNKNKDIYVYTDDAIKKYDFGVLQGRLFNPEFSQVIAYFQKYVPALEIANEESQRLANKASIVSTWANRTIQRMVRNFNEQELIDPDDCQAWANWRTYVLQHPTIAEEQLDKEPDLVWMYMQAPCKTASYSYRQQDDFRKVEIKFDDSLPAKMSEDAVGLRELFNIPGLRDWFVAQGYATAFENYERLLCPPVFNNIYKGALGEAVGRYIIEKYTDIRFLNVETEHFEKFDSKDQNGIYYDFKFWQGPRQGNAAEEKAKILEKLNVCRGTAAIIVNICFDCQLPFCASCPNDVDVGSSQGRIDQILEIPYLYRSDRHELAYDMIQTIKEYVDAIIAS